MLRKVFNMNSWNILLCSFMGFCLLTRISTTSAASRPHIIFILADDLGWNDVGFHGSNQIPTPNIDALGYYGLIMNNYYIETVCTPSRSALMTGRYPIHNGMQHSVLFLAEPRGLPLNETLLPEYLKQLGYATHIVGKWDLGNYKKEYTPLYRGFDTHLGFWGSEEDYFDHSFQDIITSEMYSESFWGYDMRRGMETAWDLHGQYTTDIFTDEAVNIINAHNASEPMFLYLAYNAVHWGSFYNLIPAMDEEVVKFQYIKDDNRSRYAGVLSRMDDGIGRVVEALQQAGMLKDSIVIFSTDNGGAAQVCEIPYDAASNWPLRGSKGTLFEGGSRGTAVMWSNLLESPSRVSDQLMHITDWLPTLYYIAGGDTSDLTPVDGVNVWDALSNNGESNRTEVLHNIDPIEGTSALTLDNWKIISGTFCEGKCNGWYGPSNRDDTTLIYNIHEVLNSPAGKALATQGNSVSPEDVENLRSQAEVKCDAYTDQSDEEFPPCDLLQAPCLFNIKMDPCEKYNLAERYPDKLKYLQQILTEYSETAVPPSNLPPDPRSNPKYWNRTWTNFGDYI